MFVGFTCLLKANQIHSLRGWLCMVEQGFLSSSSFFYCRMELIYWLLFGLLPLLILWSRTVSQREDEKLPQTAACLFTGGEGGMWEPCWGWKSGDRYFSSTRSCKEREWSFLGDFVLLSSLLFVFDTTVMLVIRHLTQWCFQVGAIIRIFSKDLILVFEASFQKTFWL